jgi:hypothetical protein
LPRSDSANSPLQTELNQVKVKVTLRLTVSQSVSLGVEPHLGLMTRYLILFDSYLLTASLIYLSCVSDILATGSQRVLLRRHRVYNGVALETLWCSAARLGTIRHGLPRLETARSKHRFPYCCVACLQTSVSLRLLHGVNTSYYLQEWC